MWHELVDQLQAVYLFYSKHFEFSYLPDTLLHITTARYHNFTITTIIGILHKSLICMF